MTRDVSQATRVRWAARRRLMLGLARLRHRQVRFGAGCDVRRRMRVTVFRGGRVRFGAGCVLDADMVVEARGELTVGDHTIFGHHCTLAAHDSVHIGRDCLVAEMVSIRDHDHAADRLDVPVRLQGSVTAPVVIGDNVWLGSKCTVTRGVTIGDNAIIGAGAVVTKDVPANAVAVGVPAKVIRFRSASPTTP